MFINVDFEINPTGSMIVKWTIPKACIKLGKKYKIDIPGYKYDLPRFLSIPVPFSSIAYILDYSLLKASKNIDINFQSGKYGNKKIVFEMTRKSKLNDIIIAYEIKNILNTDGVYFVSVYPFRSPFNNIKHHINMNAKYSYNIKKYIFWERYFEYPTNLKINNSSSLISQTKCDECTVTGVVIPKENITLDLHLTGTRLKLFLRRDIFWIVVFIITLFVFLSPFLTIIFSLLASNGTNT